MRGDLERAERRVERNGGTRYQSLVDDFGYSVEEVVVGLGLDSPHPDATRDDRREALGFMSDNDYGDPDPYGVGDHEADGETPFGTGDD